jgi:hypothetical protein
MISGTDEHINTEIRLFTKVVLQDPTDTSTQGIFESLKTNKQEVIVVDLYANTIPWPMKDSFDVLNYFLGISIGQTISWIIWSLSLFTLFSIVFIKIKGNYQ